MRTTRFLAALTLAALAGPLPAAAVAQMAPNGWIIKIQDPILAPAGHPSGLPQSTVITVCAKFDSDEDYAFAAGLFDLVAGEVGIAGVNWTNARRLSPFDRVAPGLPDDGTPTATGATGAKPGQINFPAGSIFADPSNPAMVWTITYTATDFRARSFDLRTATDPGPKGFHLFADMDRSLSYRVDPSMLMEGGGRIQIIPAPGAPTLLGLAGLALARRRR